MQPQSLSPQPQSMPSRPNPALVQPLENRAVDVNWAYPQQESTNSMWYNVYYIPVAWEYQSAALGYNYHIS